MLWTMWSPAWRFTESEFEETARSFENPDFVATVIHSYRHRYRTTAGDPALEALEVRLAAKPVITVPAIVLHGTDDRIDPSSGSEGQEKQFLSSYERRLIGGAGHCLPAENAEAVSRAIRDLVEAAG